MEKKYLVNIDYCSKELTPKERIAVKDISDSKALGEIKEDEKVIINIDYFAYLQIHNEQSENKDYRVLVIVDKDGNKYSTSSDSFCATLDNLADEMLECPDEDFTIKVFTKPSKNFKGKSFLTCSIV